MPKSSTHSEYAGEGYYVEIQHCEQPLEDGTICDEYLGVNYPSDRCHKHERPRNSQPTPS